MVSFGFLRVGIIMRKNVGRILEKDDIDSEAQATLYNALTYLVPPFDCFLEFLHGSQQQHSNLKRIV